MNWFNSLANWIATQWGGTVPAFTSSIAAQLQAWIQASLASGNTGTPVQNLPVSASATPELDSLVLFGTGLLGAGGYALTRFRARRRHSEHVGSKH
jgi:hypothetical protein